MLPVRRQIPCAHPKRHVYVLITIPDFQLEGFEYTLVSGFPDRRRPPRVLHHGKLVYFIRRIELQKLQHQIKMFRGLGNTHLAADAPARLGDPARKVFRMSVLVLQQGKRYNPHFKRRVVHHRPGIPRALGKKARQTRIEQELRLLYVHGGKPFSEVHTQLFHHVYYGTDSFSDLRILHH